MSAPPKLMQRPKRRGGVLLLFAAFALIGALGTALDFVTPAARGFWLLADPGGAALIGLGGAIVFVLCARLTRLVLSRRIEEGGRDAGDHA